MRRLVLALLPALLACGCAAPPGPPLTITGQGSPPVLDAITEQSFTEEGLTVVRPFFHYHDPDGDVVYLARELVESDGPYQKTRGTPINDPAPLQERGAIFAGRWPCGPNRYHALMRAYLIDRQGNRSNVAFYDVHCNGG